MLEIKEYRLSVNNQNPQIISVSLDTVVLGVRLNKEETDILLYVEQPDNDIGELSFIIYRTNDQVDGTYAPVDSIFCRSLNTMLHIYMKEL